MRQFYCIHNLDRPDTDTINHVMMRKWICIVLRATWGIWRHLHFRIHATNTLDVDFMYEIEIETYRQTDKWNLSHFGSDEQQPQSQPSPNVSSFAVYTIHYPPYANRKKSNIQRTDNWKNRCFGDTSTRYRKIKMNKIVLAISFICSTLSNQYCHQLQHQLILFEVWGRKVRKQIGTFVGCAVNVRPPATINYSKFVWANSTS